MFCSSLRKRPTWAHIVPVLENDKKVAWKEANLDSHDIAFPVFRPGTSMHAFRITLLTAEDMETSSGRQRVARLSHVSSGKAAAVIFLLENRGGDAMNAFMKLQVDVATSSPMVLNPLASMSDLHPTLLSLRRWLNQAPGVPTANAGPEDISGISALLSTCLGRSPTMNEMAALRRLSVTTVQDLALKATTLEGQAMLKGHFNGEFAERVVAFFANGSAIS